MRAHVHGSIAILLVAAILAGCAEPDAMLAPAREGARAVAPAVLLAAGDIAGCKEEYKDETAELLASTSGTVAALGDVVQKDGMRWEYRKCYAASWGRVLSRTRPSPGNHDYRTDQAAAYYEYFGDRAGSNGRGWYTYKPGSWRIYSLNSERDIARQTRWLERYLAANPSQCILAYWHRPLFTSGRNPGEAAVRPWFHALYAAGAEVVLSGHNHQYERFAPQDAAGNRTDAGVRQFVIGTGEAPLEAFVGVQPHSEIRDAATWGVLKLSLYPGRYTWKFLPVLGGETVDSGSGTCS